MAADPKGAIDAFIASKDGWQQDLLLRLRGWSHEMGVPIMEKVRWGAPYFDHKGIMYGMMTFKKHINLFFNKGALISDPNGLFETPEKGKGSRSVKFYEGHLVDEKVIKALFAEAIAVNVAGKTQLDAKPKSKALRTPSYMTTLIKADPKALDTWMGMPPSHKREYIEWIVEAKRTDTRERRSARCVAMLAAGEGLNDKYR